MWLEQGYKQILRNIRIAKLSRFCKRVKEVDLKNKLANPAHLNIILSSKTRNGQTDTAGKAVFSRAIYARLCYNINNSFITNQVTRRPYVNHYKYYNAA